MENAMQMPLIHYFLMAWKNAFVYSGRSRRSEFWWCYLANVIIVLILNMLAQMASFFSIICSIYSIAIIFPAISLGIRRLHDINKSGWFYLCGLIPIVGSILLIIWFATDSVPGENQYGLNPKEISSQ